MLEGQVIFAKTTSGLLIKQQIFKTIIMKNAIFRTKLFLMVLSTIMILSCSVEDGEDGALGPQGEQGLAGADGQDGNANIIASEWFPQEFPDVSTPNTFFTRFDTNFTSEIISKSAILVYGRTLNNIWPIPFNSVFFNESYSYSITSFPPSKIDIFASSVDGTPILFDRITDFRYVIIPPNTASKSNSPDFTQMSYEEVMDYFGLAY